MTIWGLIGVHTDKFGFKHVWEIWVYQAFYGLMVCPWYAYSQTMISEVSPLPQMYYPSFLIRGSAAKPRYRFLFFALFSVVRYPRAMYYFLLKLNWSDIRSAKRLRSSVPVGVPHSHPHHPTELTD